MTMLGHEKAWAAVALQYAKRYEDSNPDVGMGPFIDSILEDIIPAGVKLSDADKADIIALAGYS